MAPAETMQARQAALFLHGLAPAVQRQVIAKLDAAESARLKPLLAELTELGVAPSLGQSLQHLASSPQVDASTPAERALSVHERVEQLSAADVVRCLQLCAPATLAQLMRASAWPWKQQVLGLLPEARRSQVIEHMRGESHALAPAALSTLCERLCRHAAQLPADRRPKAGHETSVQPQTRTHSRVLSPVRARLRRMVTWIR